MDFELVKKLVKLVDSSNVTDFTIEEGDLKIKISKRVQAQTVYAQAPAQQIPFIQETRQTAPAADTAEKPAEVNSSNLHEIKSPIVGTFYRAPAPDSDPYVQVGDTVSQGTVLCIVEAMKLMNEIEADVSGKIVRILVENGRPVEYNQPLFLIEKS